jgi:hypothetical protein
LGLRVPQELKPQLRFYAGLIVGGVLGVVITILVFSAFLFQVLQAISTAVLAFATVVLALSTLSLYRVTRFQAGIEVNRDRRANLENRIYFANALVHTLPITILNPLQSESLPHSFTMEPASWIRELRQLINYNESQIDNEIFEILPPLDLLIMKMDFAETGKKALQNEEENKAAAEWVDRTQKLLLILLQRWRSQITFLYE